MEKEIKELQESINEIKKYTLLAAKNVLNFEDVALLTGLSKSYLYKLTCSHEIPYYKPSGKQIYFDRNEVEKWLKQNRIATDVEIETKAATYVATGRMMEGGIK